jgi:capsule polysaccharide export protein KpsE/RkpR
MSAKLRSDAGFSTPWSDVGQEIDRGLRAAQQMIVRADKFRRATLREGHAERAAQDWQSALSNFEKKLAELNSQILKFNLLIPPQMPQLHRPRLRPERVLEELGITTSGEEPSNSRHD